MTAVNSMLLNSVSRWRLRIIAATVITVASAASLCTVGSTNESLANWFDGGLLAWRGNTSIPQRVVPDSELPFIRKMIQRRHILIHNGGIVDQEYLNLAGDNQVQLGERISIRRKEAKRFIELTRMMADNFMDNVEYGFGEV